MKVRILWTVLIIVGLILASCQSAPSEIDMEEVATEPVLSEVEVVTEEEEVEEPEVEVPVIPLPENPKRVVIGMNQEPDNITPYFTTMASAFSITQLTMLGLAEWDGEGNMVPDLAVEIPTAENGGISEDGLTITWQLKEGLVWSDGAPLTSADVKFTWEMTMSEDNASLWRTGYDKIDRIELPDDYTVVIHFNELYPPWYTLFTQGPQVAGAILPRHILEGKTNLELDPYARIPSVVTGPFIIVDWIAGDRIELLPNANYHKARPKIDQIFVRFVPDSESALAGLQVGDIDLYTNFTEVDIPTLLGLAPDIETDLIASPYFEHYLFNLQSSEMVEGFPNSAAAEDGPCVLRDINVRKAFIYGIDRQSIIDNLLGGAVEVPASQWPNSFWTNTDLVPRPYDPERAIELLESAGYTDQNGDGIREGMCDGELVTLSFDFVTTTDPLRQDVAVVVQSDLAKIGIQMTPRHVPGGTLFASYTDNGALATGDFDLGAYTQGFYPDPYPQSGDWHCDIPSPDNPGGFNLYGVCDPQLIELIEGINSSSDPEIRKMAVDEVQQYLFDQAYVIMMYSRIEVTGRNPRLILGEYNAFSRAFWNAEEWDIVE